LNRTVEPQWFNYFGGSIAISSQFKRLNVVEPQPRGLAGSMSGSIFKTFLTN